MSLTGFIKHSQSIRLLLRQHFPCPRKSATFPPIQALPLTANYAVVGQAFDYLLRFHIQKYNPQAPQKSPWVANLIKMTLSGDSEEVQQLAELEAAALPYLGWAHAYHERYLENGEVTDDLLASCLDLAIIDGLVRAGEMRGSLGQADAKDIRDLRKLYALIPHTPFLDSGDVHLNPVFSFPGGADCDLLIDDTLIEIKTTKFSEIRLDYWQQLLGYYLINLGSERPRSIHKLAIYFSRHGYLWSVDVDTIASQDKFSNFLPTWDEQVKQYYDKRQERMNTPTQTLDEMIAKVNTFSGGETYTRWLSQLNDADFALWKSYPTAPYYLTGALENEQRRRDR